MTIPINLLIVYCDKTIQKIDNYNYQHTYIYINNTITLRHNMENAIVPISTTYPVAYPVNQPMIQSTVQAAIQSAVESLSQPVAHQTVQTTVMKDDKVPQLINMAELPTDNKQRVQLVTKIKHKMIQKLMKVSSIPDVDFEKIFIFLIDLCKTYSQKAKEFLDVDVDIFGEALSEFNKHVATEKQTSTDDKPTSNIPIPPTKPAPPVPVKTSDDEYDDDCDFESDYEFEDDDENKIEVNKFMKLGTIDLLQLRESQYYSIKKVHPVRVVSAN